MIVLEYTHCRFSTAENPKWGDVNGDETVDVSDVNAVINIILGNATASDYPGKADINGSGDIDVSDVNQLINIILTSNP